MEISEIDHKIIPFFDVESTFEGKADMGEGFSPIYEFEGEDLWIHGNFYDTPTSFGSTLF